MHTNTIATPNRPKFDIYIDTFFENASPMSWEQIQPGVIALHPIQDHQRFSPNMQISHINLKVHTTDPKMRRSIRFVVHRVSNCWNGIRQPAINHSPMSWVVSSDDQNWQSIVGQPLDDPEFAMAFDVPVTARYMHVARMVPYTQTDLQSWLATIAQSQWVDIKHIGQTVENRPLEMVQVGDSQAPYHILLRARAHPWETAGNWIMHGLVDQLLNADDSQRLLEKLCFWLMPMANKDGVFRGMTRFNVCGMDLNRNWDRRADEQLAPENAALERWIETHLQSGKPINLAMCLHNDSGGQLHPGFTNKPDYAGHMKRLENLLRQHTWFTEGSQPPGCGGTDVFSGGLIERYGIDTIVAEYNAERIAKFNRPPLHLDWITYGRQLVAVMCDYFELSQP
jgi:hypothetical protein